MSHDELREDEEAVNELQQCEEWMYYGLCLHLLWVIWHI